MNKDYKIKLNINAEKIALGTVICDLFSWEHYGLLKYDKKSETIIINESMLKTIIKMVNPAQRDRKIKIIPEEDWLNNID